MSEFSIPHPLRDDETVVFLHIPKTAGTTFNALLSSQFPWEQIRPFPSPNPQPVESPDQGKFPRCFSPTIEQAHMDFSPINEQTGRPYRIILGHWDFGIAERQPSFLPITFLRHPIMRVLSIYNHILRINDQWTEKMKENLKSIPLAHLADDVKASMMFANQQTAQMAGLLWSPERPRLSREAILEQAKANLGRCAFIGITEYYDESLLLLAHTFGWQPVFKYHSLNRAPEKTSLEQVDAQTQESLMRLVDLDIELYEYAQQIYHQRFRQMIENLYGVSKPPLADGEKGAPLFNPGLRQVIAKRILADNASRQQTVTP